MATAIAALVFAVPAFASITPSSGTVSPAAMYIDGTGQAYTSQTFTITPAGVCTAGTPCTWTAKNLPSGLAITPNPANHGQTATITGTPTSGVTTATNVTLSTAGGQTNNNVGPYIVSVIERLTNAGSFGGTLKYPTGMARDPSTNRRSIYVAGSESNTIWAINPVVNPPVVSGEMTGFTGQLNFPNQMYAMQTSSLSTPSPFLFAGNYNQFGPSPPVCTTPPYTDTSGVSTCPDTVARVNLPNPGTSGTQFNLNNTCDKPTGMAQGGESNPVNVFIACAGSGNVVVFDGNTGAFVKSIALPSCVKNGKTYQAVPSGVAKTNQSGRVVVADARCDMVYMVAEGTGTVVASVSLPTAGCVTSPFTGAPSTYAANMAYDNNGGQFAYLTEPGCNRVVQVLIGPGSALAVAQSQPLGPRPYAVATGTTFGSAGQPQIDASAGNTTTPATAYIFQNGAGSNWALNYAIQLPNTPGGTAPTPVGSAAVLPQGNTTIGGTPANAYIADTGGNSVYVVDPKMGHRKGKRHMRLLMCMAITHPDRRFAFHKPVCARSAHRRAHAASVNSGGFTVDMAAGVSEGRPLAPPIVSTW